MKKNSILFILSLIYLLFTSISVAQNFNLDSLNCLTDGKDGEQIVISLFYYYSYNFNSRINASVKDPFVADVKKDFGCLIKKEFKNKGVLTITAFFPFLIPKMLKNAKFVGKKVIF